MNSPTSLPLPDLEAARLRSESTAEQNFADVSTQRPQDSRPVLASAKRDLCGNLSSHLEDTDGKARGGYHDFSHEQPGPPDEVVYSAASSASKPLSTKEPTFPVKLHMILSNKEFEDIIAWLPHGRSWRILQQKAFEERVIPLYFRHGRYSSFARQVNGWGFRRITHGSDYNSYYHELFLRGMPHLCHKMRRLTTKDMSERKKSEEEPAPDFYAMARDNPLPETNGSKPIHDPSSDRILSRRATESIDPPILPCPPAFRDSALSSAVSSSSDRSDQENNRAKSPRTMAQIELALLEHRRAEILSNLGAMPIDHQENSGHLALGATIARNNRLRLEALIAMNKTNPNPPITVPQLPSGLGHLPLRYPWDVAASAGLLQAPIVPSSSTATLLERHLLSARASNNSNLADLLILSNNSTSLFDLNASIPQAGSFNGNSRLGSL